MMSIALLLFCGLLFSSLSSSNTTDEQSSDDGRSSEDDDDKEITGTTNASLLPEDEHSSDFADPAERLADQRDPFANARDQRLVLEIPDSSLGEIDFANRLDGAETIKVMTEKDMIKLSWRNEGSASLLTIEAGDGSLVLNFQKYETPPLNKILLSALSGEEEIESQVLSTYVHGQGPAIFKFGSTNGALQVTEPGYSITIGSGSNDDLSVIGHGEIAEVYYERGIVENSGDWTAQIYSGQGSDFIDVQNGNFLIYGGDDDDKIEASDSSAIIFGGTGNDSVNVNGVASFASGGNGNDSIMSGASSDTLIGGAGADTIWGQGGDDLIDGYGLWFTEAAQRGALIENIIEYDQNEIYGGDGDDTLIATSGDIIASGMGADEINIYATLESQPIILTDIDHGDKVLITIFTNEVASDEELYSRISFRQSDESVYLLFEQTVIAILPANFDQGRQYFTIRFSAPNLDGNSGG